MPIFDKKTKKKEEKPQKADPKDQEVDAPVVNAGSAEQSPEDIILSNYREFKGYFERDAITLLSELLDRVDKLEPQLKEINETLKKAIE